MSLPKPVSFRSTGESYRGPLPKEYVVVGDVPGGGGEVSWEDVMGKPSTFPPATHTHSIADVTGLQAALDGKQAVGDYATQGDVSDAIDAIPAPTWGDVSGKPSTFTPAAHTHAIADVTGLQAALDALSDRLDDLEG